MFTCQLCLKEFKRKDNMLRHLKTIHDENESDIEMSERDSDSDIPVDSEDEDPWDDLITESFEQCDYKYRENVKDYIKEEGVPEEEARQRIYGNMRDTYRKALANALTDKVLWFNNLRKDPIYKAIKKTVSSLQTETDYDEDEATRYGISKRKYMLDRVLKQYEAPELSEDEDSEEIEQNRLQRKQDQSNPEQTGGASMTIVSPVQGTVNIAKSEMDRELQKRKRQKDDKNRPFKKRAIDEDTNIHVIGKVV